LSSQTATAAQTITGKNSDWSTKSWMYARSMERCFISGEERSLEASRGDREDFDSVSNGKFWWGWNDLNHGNSYFTGAFMSKDLHIGDDFSNTCYSHGSQLSRNALGHWGINPLDLVCSPEMQAQNNAYWRDGKAQN